VRALAPAGILLAIGLAACGTEPGACTLNVVPGITVRALEAATGRNVTDSAQGTVADVTYVDSLRPTELDAAQRILRLGAAYERPGTYGVFVERPGYQAVSLSEVKVRAGECHVHTAALDLTMVPIPEPVGGAVPP
jgi:hypothetical protein